MQVLGLSVLNGLLFRLQLRSLPSVRVVCIAGSEDRAMQPDRDHERHPAALLPLPLCGTVQGPNSRSLPAGTGAVVLDDSLDAEARRDLLLQSASSGLRVYVVPSAGDLLLQNPAELLVGDQLLLEVRPLGYQPADAFFKRILDIVVSLVPWCSLRRCFLSWWCSSRLSSGRPVFYCQPRLGAHGVRFMTIKFRTMDAGAEDETGPVLSADGDTRITRVGRFLRKTGLDEVPQFINVLRGEMSVVGPRPERPELAGDIEAEHPEFVCVPRSSPASRDWRRYAGGMTRRRSGSWIWTSATSVSDRSS